MSDRDETHASPKECDWVVTYNDYGEWVTRFDVTGTEGHIQRYMLDLFNDWYEEDADGVYPEMPEVSAYCHEHEHEITLKHKEK